MAASLSIRFEPPFGTAKNPYLRLLAGALRDEGHQVEDGLLGPMVLHLHWPEAPFNGETWWECVKGVGRAALDLRSARRHGATVIWTVHNLRSHEHRWWGEGWHRRWLIRQLDGWITLSDHAHGVASGWPGMAGLPNAVIPHGDLAVGQRPGPSTAAARLALGLTDGAVVASFGQPRGYRGTNDLVRVFASVNDESVWLLLTGPHDQLDGLAPGARDRIVVADGPLSDGDITRVVRAADLLVFPFLSITHSSSVLLSVGLGRRVLVPALGAMPEVAAEFPGWIRTYEPPLDPEVLQSAVAWSLTTEPPPADLTHHAWTAVATQTIDLYRRARSRSATEHRTGLLDRRPRRSRR